jgi:tRNA modification GTPase
MDLIAAQSDHAAASAVEQLAGRLSAPINTVYERVVGAAADLEASLDFPEEDFPDDVTAQAGERLRQSLVTLDSLLKTWEEGHRLRDGVLVVITGRPNAGKSTLLNRLLQRERAIVSPHPGTTRDAIEETFVLNGIPLRLVDTAGLRTTDCSIEKEGIARTRKYMTEADLRIHVVDASLPLSDDDRTSLGESDPRRTLVFLNKTDLESHVSAYDFNRYTLCKGSLLQSGDLTPVLDALGGLLNQATDWTPHATLSERHRHLLSRAQTEIRAALERIDSQQPEGWVPAAAHLREAAGFLGQVTGRIFYQDMLDQIFSRFCIGK